LKLRSRLSLPMRMHLSEPRRVAIPPRFASVHELAVVRAPSPACVRRWRHEVATDERGFRSASTSLIRPLLTQGAPSPAKRKKECAALHSPASACRYA